MEKKEWKNCPNCDGFIPKNWERHEKCGWGVENEKTESNNQENSDTKTTNSDRDDMKAELNIELMDSRITVTRKETRQIRDFENNTYTVSITKPVETVNREDIRELQKLTKELIGEQKKEDGVEDK